MVVKPQAQVALFQGSTHLAFEALRIPISMESLALLLALIAFEEPRPLPMALAMLEPMAIKLSSTILVEDSQAFSKPLATLVSMEQELLLLAESLQ